MKYSVNDRSGFESRGSKGRPRTGPPGKVTVRVEEMVIPTYLPAPPDKNPMFLEKRVYQGSSGRVYPLPFTDRIEEHPVDRKWQAIWIENEYLSAMVLPELGGRIHVLQDRTNGYDLIYRQPVIKPALVGLAGPWISGGIEFNWPQHHRPATFLPVEFEIEEHKNGSRTIWCSDHDPMARMKGMHGVCLHPGKAWLELKVRAYNRTQFVQTFLWWANVATRVHESYRSFFPPDVYYVADHARRSTSEYPLARGLYYGVSYGERGRTGIPAEERPARYLPTHCGGRTPVSYAPNDLSFYANIPTPCSYMCMGSREDFFGGYDFAAQAGIVHFANHHISPGKKQWTWGNHDFGYAWDRNLTDEHPGGEFPPYIEIMAGVYTDNQPDFSFLQPGETKTWSQYWYPIQKIGPAQHATLDTAVSVRPEKGGIRLGVAVTQPQPRASIVLASFGRPVARFTRDLSPSSPFLEVIVAMGIKRVGKELSVRVEDQHGRELLRWEMKPRRDGEVPAAATEPPAPSDIAGNDELFITGLHLEQYRHATRCPSLYWNEALRRDPADSRCNNAMGLWRLKRGEFKLAESHFRRALERLTRRNPNPYDGEASYNLGLCLRYLGRDEEGYAAFYKATWNQAWVAAGCHALAEIDCTRQDWNAALEHLDQSLRFNADNTRARALKAIVLRKLGRGGAAAELLQATLALDPLDIWARHLCGLGADCDLQAALDVALDFARAGFHAEAAAWLNTAQSSRRSRATANGRVEAHPLPTQDWGAQPMLHYTRAWLLARTGDLKAARRELRVAQLAPPDYCFPARLEEIAILGSAIRANPRDGRAPYYLGNLYYDRRRHAEALTLWERAAKLDPGFSVVWRNLGSGRFNISRKPAQAAAAYDRAFKANPLDARLLYERDQLWKRLGRSPATRLRALKRHAALVQRRDDLTVELCALYNQVGKSEAALEWLTKRHFQPWEGGEGGPLGQYVRANLALGRKALARGEAALARKNFEQAFATPHNLGEARHLLANQSDLHYWLGCALTECGDRKGARDNWSLAANFKGDFREMSARAFSEKTYFSALSWLRLGRKAAGQKLLRQLLAYARSLQRAPAKIDYFATSLPTMLLFDDDLQFRQETTALFLQAQARLGLRQTARARSLLKTVLRRDPNHALAADHLAQFLQPRHALGTAVHALRLHGGRERALRDELVRDVVRLGQLYRLAKAKRSPARS